jgi:dTDP-glucose 4,6-dehydratase
MKTILVTGGAGFIGSNFIRYILNARRAYRVVNLDKLTYAGNLENLKDVSANKNYRFIHGDITDQKLAGKVSKGCQIIINFAASSHVDRSILSPDDFMKTNFYGTYTLLEAARHNKIERFIQISSDEVYGSIRQGQAKEDAALNPSSPYSVSKAAADLLVQSYKVTYGLNVNIVRLSNNFGPYQYPEKLIPLLITNALENKKIPLYAQGKNKRNWLFVLDSCRAISLVLGKGMPGEIYNISAGNELNNLQLIKRVLSYMGKSAGLIEPVKDRPGHDFRYAVDWAKIKKLGFTPQYKFDSALEETIGWYTDNTAWWEKIKKKTDFTSYYKKHYNKLKK